MRHFIHLQLFLILIVCQISCGHESSKPNANTIASTKPNPTIEEYQDSVESYTINVKGDSVAYLHWAANDEITGIANTAFGDLDSIVKRGYIRVLVPYSKTYYYVEGMKRYGLAYELVSLFEKELNKILGYNPPKIRVIFIPVSRVHILELLTSGHADMIASGYAITPEREEKIDFSIPTVTGTKDILVGGPNSPPIHSVYDLAGQHVCVRENTSNQASLIRLNKILEKAGRKPMHIDLSDPYFESEDILEMVNEGMMPFTVVSDDLGKLWNSVYTNLKVYPEIAVDSNVSYGWAVRKNSPQLKAVINKFISTISKGTLAGNMIYNKYLKNTARLKNAQSKEALANLNRYKASFQHYGKAFSIDWLLLSAQAFQESQLNQQTVSHKGAVGVMQLLPSTAAQPPINISNIRTADNNIHAGVKYMRYLLDQYNAKDQMDSLNEQLIALAAYNCGPGNVRKLRREAIERGLNPNIWFDNVEILAAHHIGRETVQYVSNIYVYYRSYQALQRYKEYREKGHSKR
ncbi:MAG: lytic transglycosylase F [Bacteroidetes bacterium]|nr:MAG: lytic transglycosylase F [Bacteroidota bacterium]